MASERSVGELLDELFGFESVAKRQTALEQYDRGELVRKARSRELLGVLRGVEASEHAARESVVRAVDGYVRRVEGAALARARKRAGIVGPLRMERRYAAFLRMEDKAELLTRLAQTLAFVEVKLRANTAARVRAAYDAAGAYSVYERYKELFGFHIEMKEDYYFGKEIIQVAEEIKDEYGDRFLNNFDLDFFKSYGTEKLLGNLKKDLKKFNVEFDTWFSEKSLYETKEVENVLTNLKKQGYTYQKDGALWLKTTDYGDEKDRVIIKSDGSYTYLLPDIAYHANKLSRGYHHLIDVLGADHHGYIHRLKAAVSMVGGNSNLIDVEILQMVRVIEDGVEVKMSKRSGKAITLIDLIDDVGTDALRYFYVAKSLSTHMDLDLDLMKQKSNDNPVFYAQYAYARICSIFKNAKDNGIDFIPVEEFNEIDIDSIKDICLVLLQYPNVLLEVAEKRLVHKLTHYIDDLAYQLHSYYNDQKVITDNKQLVMEKLTVLLAIKIVLKDSLTLIGVSTPEKM